jgi:hypothetical protein
VGSGADAGLVEGLADASGGRSDFVDSCEDLSLKVIPQLELSIQPGVSDVAIHIEYQYDLEVTPSPMPSITPNVSFPFFVRASGDLRSHPILLAGWFMGEHIDIVIESEACSAEISRCLQALFAFETIRSLERRITDPRLQDNPWARPRRSEEYLLESRCVVESLESGVLCRETAFVGFSNAQTGESGDGLSHFGALRDDAEPSGGAAGCCASGASALDDSPRRTGRRRKSESWAPWTVDLGDVTALQAFDGSWGNAGQLFDLIQRRVAEFSVLSREAKRKAIFATIVGIAILRAKFAEKEPAWRIVERKALKWLAARDAGFEELIEEAVRQLAT